MCSIDEFHVQKNASTVRPQLEMHTQLKMLERFRSHIFYIYIESCGAIKAAQDKRKQQKKKQHTPRHTSSIFILKSDKNAKCPSNLMRIKILFMVNDCRMDNCIKWSTHNFFFFLRRRYAKYINSNLYSLYVI